MDAVGVAKAAVAWWTRPLATTFALAGAGVLIAVWHGLTGQAAMPAWVVFAISAGYAVSGSV